MTPEGLEKIRLEIRLLTTQSALALLLRALSKSQPDVTQSVIDGLDAMTKQTPQEGFPGLNPEYSDMLAEEAQETLATLLKILNYHVRHPGHP